MAGNYTGAAHVFKKTAEARRDSRPGSASGREEALYWQARSEELAGKSETAAETYETLLDEFPDGFYAYLAERRTGKAARPPVTVETANDVLPDELTSTISLARELQTAGLDDFAVVEITRAVGRVEPGARKAALPTLVAIGAYTPALRTSLDLYRRRILDENQLYPFIYPRAYEQVVVREAGSRNIDPYLVYSLMRQESLFDQRAVSPAAAYGLMQLLLTTARRMGTRTGMETVDLEDLFRPEVNVKLGTEYLADLAERFDDDPVLILAGYNAGEKAAERWKEQNSGVELDEFIEKISYRETRNYVKKVLRNYRNYLRLYGEIGAGGAAERAEQTPR